MGVFFIALASIPLGFIFVQFEPLLITYVLGIVDVFLFLGVLFLLGMMFPELAAHNTDWGALKD